jgi:5-amino-6-(5-phosphoribosylamino)uracil reductase
VNRPYVVLSAAVSLDGCLDDTGPDRLVLSSPEDLDAVDGLRADVDAVLVGAGTARADNPRLLVRSPARRAARVALGLPESPARVVLSASGRLDPAAALFTVGEVPPLLYLPREVAGAAARRFGSAATVREVGERVELAAVLADLSARGVRRLLVEGGAVVHALFLDAGAVDELRLAVAPCFVGDPAAPRLLGPRSADPARRLRLAEVGSLGDTAVLRYLAR